MWKKLKQNIRTLTLSNIPTSLLDWLITHLARKKNCIVVKALKETYNWLLLWLLKRVYTASNENSILTENSIVSHVSINSIIGSKESSGLSSGYWGGWTDRKSHVENTENWKKKK